MRQLGVRRLFVSLGRAGMSGLILEYKKPFRMGAMSKQASCQCGGFRATVAAEPAIVMMCHCTSCQRRSGVPLTVNAYFKGDDVKLEGDFQIFERPAPEGRKVYNHFCPTCG